MQHNVSIYDKDPNCSDKDFANAVMCFMQTPTVINGLLVTLRCNRYDDYITKTNGVDARAKELTEIPEKNNFTRTIKNMVFKAFAAGKENCSCDNPEYVKILQQFSDIMDKLYAVPLVALKFPNANLTLDLLGVVDRAFWCGAELTRTGQSGLEYARLSGTLQNIIEDMYTRL
jgi:hypothetical protein